MNPRYPEISRRASRRCEYFLAPETVFNYRFEVKHIHPQVRGGLTELENLALACRCCNSFKAAFTTGVDPETGESVPLFHPRQQTWEDHFAFDPESGTLLGLTPTGQATIVRLDMNDEMQLEARSRWVVLNLFP